jgi:signal transduction histidine kinase
LRASGRQHEALVAYDRLATFTDVVIEGRPADLIARLGRCRALQDLAQAPQLRQEAELIRADLVQGKWPIAGAAWQATFDDVIAWAGSGSGRDHTVTSRVAIADGLAKYTDLLREGRPAHPTIVAADGGSSLIVPVTDEAASIVAVNADWLMSLWSDRASAGLNVALIDRDDQAVIGLETSHAVQGTSVDPGLPWTVAVSDADPERARAGIAARRRTLVAGLAVVALLIAASGYFTFRGIRRELSTARMHAEFVSAASHELRTPLTSIRQLVHMLQDGRVESDERRGQYYSVLVRETERLHRLVDRLLKFGRVDAAQFRLETVDARALAQHVAEDFRKNITDRTFEVSTPETPCPLKADRELLTLAVWNLLENAVKYSPAGGPVRLDVRAAEGRVRMAVTDAGIGIPVEDRQRIFQQFVRGSTTEASGPAGSGLGLALVDRVVRAHGGDVELESEPGRGSVFTIVLPMETAA